METIQGKTCLNIDGTGFRQRLMGYQRIMLDLGTGDGRYVRAFAARDSRCFAIGIDACRENLRKHSRTGLPNMLFIIANAHDLPHELGGLVSHLTINFPWGSLLEGLLIGDPHLMDGLAALASTVTSFEVRLNAGALAEAGKTLPSGAAQIHANLSRWGWQVDAARMMDATVLRAFPTTWARRLGCGRDPRAVLISGMLNRMTDRAR